MGVIQWMRGIFLICFFSQLLTFNLYCMGLVNCKNYLNHTKIVCSKWLPIKKSTPCFQKRSVMKLSVKSSKCLLKYVIRWEKKYFSQEMFPNGANICLKLDRKESPSIETHHGKEKVPRLYIYIYIYTFSFGQIPLGKDMNPLILRSMG